MRTDDSVFLAQENGDTNGRQKFAVKTCHPEPKLVVSVSTHDMLYLYIFPSYNPLERPRNHDQTIGMSTPSAQLMVSKYDILLKENRASWSNS